MNNYQLYSPLEVSRFPAPRNTPRRPLSRRSAVAGICLVLIAGAVIGGALAYLNDIEARTNNLTIAESSTKIVEDFPPVENPLNFGKTVQITNTGSATLYVRVLAEFNRSDLEELATIDFNTTEWTEKQDDGYYYYRQALTPGQTSVPLMTRVTLSALPEQGIEGAQIIVHEEAAQAIDPATGALFEGPQQAFDAIAALYPRKE